MKSHKELHSHAHAYTSSAACAVATASQQDSKSLAQEISHVAYFFFWHGSSSIPASTGQQRAASCGELIVQPSLIVDGPSCAAGHHEWPMSMECCAAQPAPSISICTFAVVMSPGAASAEGSQLSQSIPWSQSTIPSSQEPLAQEPLTKEVEEISEQEQKILGLKEEHASVFALPFKQGSKMSSGQRQRYVMALRDYCGRMADAMKAEGERSGLTKNKNNYLTKTLEKLYKPELLKDRKTKPTLKDMLLKSYKAYKEGQLLVSRAAGSLDDLMIWRPRSPRVYTPLPSTPIMLPRGPNTRYFLECLVARTSNKAQWRHNTALDMVLCCRR